MAKGDDWWRSMVDIFSEGSQRGMHYNALEQDEKHHREAQKQAEKHHQEELSLQKEHNKSLLKQNKDLERKRFKQNEKSQKYAMWLTAATIVMAIFSILSTFAAIKTAGKTAELIDTQLAPPQIVLTVEDPLNVVLGKKPSNIVELDYYEDIRTQEIPYYYSVFNPSNHAVKLKSIVINSECIETDDLIIYTPIDFSSDENSTIPSGKTLLIERELSGARLNDDFREQLPCNVLFNSTFYDGTEVVTNLIISE